MPRLRTPVPTVGMFLVLALVAWGCSSDDDKAAAAQPASAEELFTSGFQLTSANFQERVYPRVRIPKKNSCYGENLSPPFEWTEPPETTQSFALVAVDLDHVAGLWAYWVLYNIPADVTGLPEGVPTTTDVLPDGTTQGTNDERQPGYYGVCPPPSIIGYWDVFRVGSKQAPHNYDFTLYALDTQLGLAAGATREELESAMEGHILGEAKTKGKFTTPLTRAETREAKQVQSVLRQTARAGASPTPAP